MSRRQLLIELGVMLVIALALAALGPFGSFGLGPFATRLAYWLPASFTGYALVRPAVLVGAWLAERYALHRPSTVGLAVMVAALPLTGLILWYNALFFGEALNLDRWFALYLQVALIGVIVTTIFTVLDRPTAAQQPLPAPPVEGPPAPASCRFADRLPLAWNGEVDALQMEDHYVRAHRGGDSVLILMRMRDAIDELDGRDGRQVHRSWWVARAAVAQVERDGRNYRLRLLGGRHAPVSRDRVEELKGAGWL